MAHSVEITKILQGTLSQFHVYIKSDGVSSDLADEVLIDPVVDLGLTSSARLYLQNITYSLSGFSCFLAFDTGLATKSLKWVLSPESTEVCFDKYGGIRDNSGLDGNGKILISTSGLQTAGTQGSILIMVSEA